MTREEFIQKSKSMPDTPGVYFFLGPKKEVLYIGKATSLRSRVRSYFSSDLARSRSPLIFSMVDRSRSLDWQTTDSVLEALILEANLIRRYQPRYNTDAKDDKSFNYVVISREDFPRVLLVRGKNLEEEYPVKTRLYCFGPFPHGLQLREALKLVRKIFPYRDTCTPIQELLAQGKKLKPCFNRHIGLCPGVCTGEISKKDYRRIIGHIALLFQGKKKELIRELERELKTAIKEERFEEASRFNRQVFALRHIQDISLIKDEYHQPLFTGGSRRIEGYDVAHLQGSANVGVMTVVEEGLAQPREYRKFKIRTAIPGDDTGALREVLSRRLGHDEWPMPQLIVVDGGVAQMNAARSVLEGYGMHIPVIAVVKDEKHRPREIRGKREVAFNIDDREILLVNAEAHRFAIGYHRKRSRGEKGIY